VSSLAIVIVNYRTSGLVLDCLASLATHRHSEPTEMPLVWVVDNASADGSVDRLDTAIRQNGWDGWVRVLPLNQNGGFASGNNVGIRTALAVPEIRYVLLLNSDTIVRPGALLALCQAAQRNPAVGLVGPRLEFPDGAPQISTFRRISPLTELIAAARTGPLTAMFQRKVVAIPWEQAATTSPDWISFACVLIRRDVLEGVGLLDEGYFMYYEDVDYCRRAARAGWRIAHDPEAHVVHLRGGTSPVKRLAAARRRRPRYYFAARARYLARFYGRTGLWLANLLWLCGRGIAGLRELVGHKEPHVCEREGRDIWTNAWNPFRSPELPPPLPTVGTPRQTLECAG